MGLRNFIQQCPKLRNFKCKRRDAEHAEFAAENTTASSCLLGACLGVLGVSALALSLRATSYRDGE
jgi:hypothetical protein